MNLYQKQVELEQEMHELGAKRYWELIEEAEKRGEETSTRYGRELAQETIIPVAKGIEAYFSAEAKKKGVAKLGYSVGYSYLTQIDPRVTAFIAVKVIIDGISSERTITGIAMAIGKAIEDELRFTAFQKGCKALWETLTRNLDKATTNRRHKRRVLIHSMNKAAAKGQDALKWSDWTESERLHIGMRLIDITAAHTKMFTRHTYDVGKAMKTTLAPTLKLQEWISKRSNQCELLSPMYLPMVIEPKPWTMPLSGGYISKAMRPMKAVKTRNVHYIEEICGMVEEMSTVYQAVNAVQSTPWKINQAILATQQQVWGEDLDLGVFVPQTDMPLPPKPHDIETNKEARKLWSRDASRVHAHNSQQTAKRFSVNRILWLGEKFKDEKAIWFPHQLDFRGRMYAVPTFLQPQGHDQAKSLLCFAQGKRLGSSGTRWLKIHAANCFGYDKVSLDERVVWAEENMPKIVASSTDPLAERWWTQADKPWQFLAACFEIHEANGNPEFISHLPVSVDGSCNGLQNFSAMLRDPIGGAATNLVPSRRPSDIYTQVAEVARVKVMREAIEGNEDAERWLKYGFDRKATKRPVMTLPYGATNYSARQYVHDYMVEKGGWPEKDSFKGAIYLTRHIWTSIGEVVVAARQAMDWLQKVARVASNDGDKGLPVNWRTPVGFPVWQAYMEMKSRRVRTKMGDSIIVEHLIQDETDRIDRKRQASGISPNFVHSMDAAALMLTVKHSLASGVTAFGMVHDSYGTHAGDMDTLSVCLREAFVELYQHDVLEEFRQSILAGVSEEAAKKIPPCPPKGDLDLNAVKDSVYFFA